MEIYRIIIPTSMYVTYHRMPPEIHNQIIKKHKNCWK